MSEVDDPFKAFKEGAPPAETKAPDKAPKKARKKAVGRKRAGPANGGVPDATPAVSPQRAAGGKTKKTRKPRQKRELKLPLSTLLALGSLSPEESSVVQSMAIGFADFSKKSRGRIVAALGKIFG